MALNSNDLKNDLVAAIVAADSTLTQPQIDKMVLIFEKMAIAITDQIKRGSVNVVGNGNFLVQ
jgi:hypothetical protein